MLSVIFAKCGKIGLHAECHYGERRYAERRYAERHGTDLIAKFASDCVFDCEIE
jgi:hypothetical protein